MKKSHLLFSLAGCLLFCSILVACSRNKVVPLNTSTYFYSEIVGQKMAHLHSQKLNLLKIDRGCVYRKISSTLFNENYSTILPQTVLDNNEVPYKDRVRKVTLLGALVDLLKFIGKVLLVLLLIPICIILFYLWGAFISSPFWGIPLLSELIKSINKQIVHLIDTKLRKKREEKVTLLKKDYPQVYQALCPYKGGVVSALPDDCLKGLSRMSREKWRSLNTKIEREEELNKKIARYKHYVELYPYAINSYFGFSTIPSIDTIEKILSLSESTLSSYNEEGYLLYLIMGDDAGQYPPGKFKYRLFKKHRRKRIQELSSIYPRAFALWSGGIPSDHLSDRLSYLISIQDKNKWAHIEEQCKKEEDTIRRKEARKRYQERLNKAYDDALANHPIAIKDFFLVNCKSIDNTLKNHIAVLSEEALSRFDIQGSFLYDISHNSKGDADSIKNYLINSGVNCFYHFTDKSNIESILKNGGLYSWQYCLNNSLIIPKPGGGELSRRLDQKFALGDFVRLSFCSDHPMMKRLEKSGYNLMMLKIKIDVACLAGTLFSDMNATDSCHHHGASLEDLKKIDIYATKQAFVSRDSNIFKKHQAEVLVKTFIPTEYIIDYDYYSK